MSLLHAFDAAVPPADAPKGIQIALGYIGAPGRTPHVWTPAQWLPFAHLYQGPIWEIDFSRDATVQGIDAAAAARRLGFAPDAHRRRAIFAASEAVFDLAAMHEFCAAVWHNGYLPVPTGSASSVVHYAELGYPLWVELWDQVPDVPPIPDIVGHQYESDVPEQGTQIDLSVFSADFAHHFGVKARRQA